MRKLSSPYWIVILTFVVGITATFSWLRYFPVIESFEKINFTKIPTVELCDLRDNPRKYDGKIIRLKSKLNWFMHGYFLTDDKCLGVDDESRIATSFYEPKMNELNKQLLSFHDPSRIGWEPVEMVAVGRFTYKNFIGHNDGMDERTHLQFEIHTIEFATR